MTLPAKTGDHPVRGAGLGLRRALLGPLRSRDPGSVDFPVDFMEIAPENWIGVGGSRGRQLREYTDRIPFVCHGLSLSIGGPSPLDETFLHRLRQFLDRHQIRCYSEHLSYCTDDGHLYDLMPIPFTGEAVRYVAQRVRRVQDILERRIALENVSYYAAPGAELSELEFVSAVLEEADCNLLLDVNNIYVNSVNHRYDALQFLRSLPGERIAYGHIAGHHKEAADLIVDTHGAGVIAGVWDLLDQAYQAFGVFPTLLERDFNLPPVDELLREVEVIRNVQQKYQAHASPSRRRRA
ncbi:MAG: DUF692 domain-containing protein [Lysobacterales bacterium]|nr:MAG: DUF692 domain-containing protein [Xanthomonadales bacterium]